MAEKQQVPEETKLKFYLRNVVSFISLASEAFDKGYIGEARRMAACIRVLVEEKPEEPSLLTKLNLKDIVYYDESPDYNPEIGLPMSGLATVTIGGTSHKYVPRLGTNPKFMKRVDFEKWWTKPVVVDEAKNLRLSRKDIIIGVSQSSYGAVDPKLDPAFTALIQGSWKADMTPMPELIEMIYVSVRQIAYELRRTLFEMCPGYV